MDTIIYKLDPKAIDKGKINQAGALLREGKLVAFPTETVYGIGANALDDKAIKNIFKAKGRPADNPLIVHFSRKEDVFLYAKDISDDAIKLMDNFWPGPLTMVLKKRSIISNLVTGGLDTMAVRMPDNPIALALIEASGIPVAAPSANTSGRPSPTKAAHVIDDLSGKVDMVIEGGPSQVGIESTVIDMISNPLVILRPGAITKEMIETCLDREVVISKPNMGDGERLMSPGMKYKHYSPRGQVLLISLLNRTRAIDYINKEFLACEKAGIRLALITSEEIGGLVKRDNVFIMGKQKNQQEIASNMYALLRKMDDLGMEKILITSVDQDGLGSAIMNRLIKAAAGKIIFP